MDVIGTLIPESLKSDAVLTVPLTLRSLSRIVIDQPAPGQPPVWTLIDFACSADDADRFADELAAALSPGPWYVDMATETTKHVVFAGRRFAFLRNDSTANNQAVDYARTVGVPEAQLDWPQ